MKRRVMRTIGAGGVRDGRSIHPLWSTYCNMIARCYNPGAISYPTHGGRGIRVDRDWLGRDGFWRFAADMGPKPTPGHTLDRWPDGDADYGPYTTVWSTRTEQRETVRRADNRPRLTPLDVAQIRASTDDTATLAARYGVSRVTIWSVRSGRTHAAPPATKSAQRSRAARAAT